MIEVSAGIIRRNDGKVLICQRGEGRNNAHLWEFPGGKIEKGESPCDCLRRELLEELSLPVDNLQELCTQEAQGILFHFVEGTTQAQPILTEHEAFAFVTDRAMLGYDFCPADTQVARAMALNAPPLKHFFWDFDGTLMDTYPAMTEAFVRMAARLGVQITPERALNLMKENLTHAINVVAAENGLEAADMARLFREEEAQVLPRLIRPVSGIPQALAALDGRHYLVTHRDHMAVTYLRYAGLDGYFTDCIVSEDGFPRKPAPDSLIHLVGKHGLDTAQCVMIGDRPLDTAAGRSAGMLSCLLDEENRFPDDPCELRCSRAEELSALLCPQGVAKTR